LVVISFIAISHQLHRRKNIKVFFYVLTIKISVLLAPVESEVDQVGEIIDEVLVNIAQDAVKEEMAFVQEVESEATKIEEAATEEVESLVDVAETAAVEEVKVSGLNTEKVFNLK
jgi:hypothetical protein